MLIYMALSFSVPDSIYEGCLLTFAAVTARTLSKKAFVKVLLKRPFFKLVHQKCTKLKKTDILKIGNSKKKNAGSPYK